jgi:hypothetical protein
MQVWDDAVRTLDAAQSRATDRGGFDISRNLSIFPLPQDALESQGPPASERSENPV